MVGFESAQTTAREIVSSKTNYNFLPTASGNLKTICNAFPTTSGSLKTIYIGSRPRSVGQKQFAIPSRLRPAGQKHLQKLPDRFSIRKQPATGMNYVFFLYKKRNFIKN